MEHLLLALLQLGVYSGALYMTGRLMWASRAYLSWRAPGLWGVAALVAVLSSGAQLFTVATTSFVSGLHIVFGASLFLSLREHFIADRKRLKDSYRLMDQWRQATRLAQRRANELEVLFSLTRELAASLDLRQVLRTVVDRSLVLGEADAVTVFERNRDTNELVNYQVTAAVTERLKDMPAPHPDGLTTAVAKSGQAAFVGDVRKNPLYADRYRDIRAVASLPLIFEGEVVGVMNVLYSKPHDFTDEEMHLMGALATTAALAVHNAAMHERIAKLAVTDELTGLANRRRFMELVRQEVQRARRYGRPLTLLMIDLDRLKQVNDQHGHAAGDAMLRGVADCIRQTTRTTDYPARLGGDEFAALLPETSREDAARIAERMRATVEKFSVVVNGALIQSTVSIGLVSRAAGEVTDLPSFIHMADDALYKSKSAGRNTVTAVEDDEEASPMKARPPLPRG